MTRHDKFEISRPISNDFFFFSYFLQKANRICKTAAVCCIDYQIGVYRKLRMLTACALFLPLLHVFYPSSHYCWTNQLSWNVPVIVSRLLYILRRASFTRMNSQRALFSLSPFSFWHSNNAHTSKIHLNYKYICLFLKIEFIGIQLSSFRRRNNRPSFFVSLWFS